MENINYALHTGEIDILARKLLRYNTVHWLGCFARDKIPRLENVPRPFALVFNSDKSNRPGQHWLAVYGESSTKDIEFFDSYGLPPSFYSFTYSYDIRSSDRSIQSLGSSVCGHYCLLFISHRADHVPFSCTINKLDSEFTDQSAAATAISSSNYSYHPMRHRQCCTGQVCSKRKSCDLICRESK